MLAIDRQEEELWANDELSLGSSFYTPVYTIAVCCCEAVVCNRHDFLDSPCTLASRCRRATRLGSKELHAQRRHVLMDDVGVARCYLCFERVLLLYSYQVNHVSGTWYLVQGTDRQT